MGHQLGKNRGSFRMILPSATTTTKALRYLNVHEYISMEIMKSHGIQVPESHVASTPEEAVHIYTNILNKRE
jgi:succinyl-CoA synthetase beta subunit